MSWQIGICIVATTGKRQSETTSNDWGKAKENNRQEWEQTTQPEHRVLPSDTDRDRGRVKWRKRIRFANSGKCVFVCVCVHKRKHFVCAAMYTTIKILLPVGCTFYNPCSIRSESTALSDTDCFLFVLISNWISVHFFTSISSRYFLTFTLFIGFNARAIRISMACF